MEKKKLKEFRLTILGDSEVGKTSIIDSYSCFEFREDIEKTIGIIKYYWNFKLNDGKDIKLIIYDSSGQDRFRQFSLTTLRNVNGIILVFDLTKKSSFENVKKWFDDIKERIIIPSSILLWNKADIKKEKLESNSEEIKNYAKEIQIPYFEVSAKNKKGINEGISYLANDIYERFKKEIEKEKEKEEEEKEKIENLIIREEIAGKKPKCIGKNKKKFYKYKK